ncbi:MAG: hypothetical protein MJ065_01400 [Oscillospiraceae bacterium]|nr:hypothetical protein [Oscillospiraceae bacterium]
MKTWICRNCNSENAMNMNFCPICHQPQIQNTAFAPPPLPSAQVQHGMDPDFLFQPAALGEMPPERKELVQRPDEPDFLFQSVQPPVSGAAPETQPTEEHAPAAAQQADTLWRLDPADFPQSAQNAAPAPVPAQAVRQTRPAPAPQTARQAAYTQQIDADAQTGDQKLRKILIAANAALIIANIIGLILWLK